MCVDDVDLARLIRSPALLFDLESMFNGSGKGSDYPHGQVSRQSSAFELCSMRCNGNMFLNAVEKERTLTQDAYFTFLLVKRWDEVGSRNSVSSSRCCEDAGKQERSMVPYQSLEACCVQTKFIASLIDFSTENANHSTVPPQQLSAEKPSSDSRETKLDSRAFVCNGVVPIIRSIIQQRGPWSDPGPWILTLFRP